MLIKLSAYPLGNDRLFFAVLPDAAAASQTEALARNLRTEHRLRGKPRKTNHFHVTLQFLGDFQGIPAEVLTAAKRAATGLSVRPFAVEFDYVMSFAKSKRRNLPLVLRGGDDTLVGLMALHTHLKAALQNAGLVLDERRNPPFTPHMTLLYDDRSVPESRVEPVHWTVKEFVLIHSLKGQSTYVPLGRWPLSAQGSTP